MINPELWNDADVGSLSIPARLLFIGLISHADDEGRGIADPRQLRKQVFGFDDLRTEDVEKLLNEIGEKVSNVKFYVADLKEYYYLTNWLRYQKISHPSPSTLPAPNGSEPPAASGGENGKSNIFKHYEANIGPLTPMIADKLKDAEATYPADNITEAIQEAVKHNKRNWAYCETILKRWLVEGKVDSRPAPGSAKQAANKSAISSVLKVN